MSRDKDSLAPAHVQVLRTSTPYSVLVILSNSTSSSGSRLDMGARYSIRGPTGGKAREQRSMAQDIRSSVPQATVHRAAAKFAFSLQKILVEQAAFFSHTFCAAPAGNTAVAASQPGHTRWQPSYLGIRHLPRPSLGCLDALGFSDALFLPTWDAGSRRAAHLTHARPVTTDRLPRESRNTIRRLL